MREVADTVVSGNVVSLDDPRQGFGSFIRFVVAIFFWVVLIRSSVLGPYKIPSSSMFPTLHIGDHILVNKLAYGIRLPFVDNPIVQYSFPRRGDIVVFTRPEDPQTEEKEADLYYIKRVIGLPGETLEVRGKTVYVNGKPLGNDPHAVWQSGGPVSGNFGPDVIPDGHVFLLGDNRDQSKDSRFWTTGHFIDVKRVQGRAFFRHYNSGLEFRRMMQFLD